jgi:hypothetical protein
MNMNDLEPEPQRRAVIVHKVLEALVKYFTGLFAIGTLRRLGAAFFSDALINMRILIP